MSQMIGDEAMIYIRWSLNIIVRGSISLFGIFSNIVNMAVYIQLGMKDSMSVGLFALSFTDFLVTSAQLASCLCYLTDLLYPDNQIDVWSIGFSIFGFLINASYLISCWITALISIERCFCVVSPFNVKQVFTRLRCVITIIFIYIIHALIHVPVFVMHRMEWKEIVPSNFLENTSATHKFIFTVHFDAETAYFEVIFDATVGIGMLYLSQAVVVVCAIWMGYSLKMSSKVRNVHPNLSSIESLDGNSSQKSGLTLSNRERRLVKVVLYLSVILIICCARKVVAAAVYHTVPGLNTGQQENASTTLWALTSTIASLGCSANIFVYLLLSTNFRRQFYQLFRCCT